MTLLKYRKLITTYQVITNLINLPIYYRHLGKYFSFYPTMGRSNLKSKIDWYIVNRVREIRLEKKMSQEEIAVHLGISRGFIGHIESPNFIAKYSTVQLNKLAKVFKCSPKDFFPEKPM